MVNDLKYLTEHEIAVLCETRAEAKLFSQITADLCEWGSYADCWDLSDAPCFDLLWSDVGYGSEDDYREDGYQIIWFRDLFMELCEKGFDLDLFARHNVAIQVDSGAEELFLIQQYNRAIAGCTDEWHPRSADSSKVEAFDDEPTCFVFGNIGLSMGFSRRSYYERNGFVVFLFSALFDICADIENGADPEIDFLLC